MNFWKSSKGGVFPKNYVADFGPLNRAFTRFFGRKLEHNFAKMRGSNAVLKFSENASVLVASTGPYPMCVQIFRVLLRGIHSTGS